MPIIKDIQELVQVRVQKIKNNGKFRGIRANLGTRISSVFEKGKIRNVLNFKTSKTKAGDMIMNIGDSIQTPMSAVREKLIPILT